VACLPDGMTILILDNMFVVEAYLLYDCILSLQNTQDFFASAHTNKMLEEAASHDAPVKTLMSDTSGSSPDHNDVMDNDVGCSSHTLNAKLRHQTNNP
jgi:hypothetical protein